MKTRNRGIYEGTNECGSSRAGEDSQLASTTGRQTVGSEDELSPRANRPELLRNLAAFWLLGLINNAAYVIMLAGAKQIDSGGVGLVYIASILPNLSIKLTGPFWFHMMTYEHRALTAAALMSVAFSTVAYGARLQSLPLQLLGVAVCSMQQGLGEPTFLALCTHYSTRSTITMWSSGTGFAGVFGYAWVVLLQHPALAGGLTFPQTLMAANLLVLVWLLVWRHLLLKPPCLRVSTGYVLVDRTVEAEGDSQGTDVVSASDDEDCADRGRDRTKRGVGTGGEAALSWRERARFVCALWRYMLPLGLVYFSEYAMQAGTWSAIGFPITDDAARGRFYSYANWCYQAGVFVSRSSGTMLQANHAMLWAMPVVQTLFLLFFAAMAVYHTWYNFGLLGPCFVTGLLGGAVYVNTYTLISRDLPAPKRELALAAVSVADTLGVLLADVFGLYLQSCIYKYNGIPGAAVRCPA